MNVRGVRSATDGVPTIVGMYEGRRPADGTATARRKAGASATAVFDATGFTGAPGQSAVVTTAAGTYVFVGLGGDLDHEALRRAAAVGRQAVPKSRHIATTLHRVGIAGADAAVVEGLALADYAYTVYRSDAEDRADLDVELIGGDPDLDGAVAGATAVASGVNLARDLVNTPPRDKAPAALADRAREAAADTSLDIEAWDVERLRDERMGGLLGVGLGSHRPPCLLIMRHAVRRPKARLAVVGKGIVFDSGGLSLKPANMMETMKSDMGGAAAVIGAMIAISRLDLGVEVTGYAALAENLPGGGAQRPGDVLTARNGKTIEVVNTDAEGRLVLADALSLAAEARPDLIVDLATLTGACKVALGDKIAGLWTNEDTAGDRVRDAAMAAGERVWPMPQPADYATLIKSDIADMRNSSTSRYGSAMAATLLLEHFVDDVPWAHLDIAGPAFATEAEHYIPKGGTGFGVRTLVELARSMA